MTPTTPRQGPPSADQDREPKPNRGGLNEEVGDLDPADAPDEQDDEGHLPGRAGGGLAGG
ncbi:MAG TPA: hypothetical protein VGC74_17150 [Stenotrophomonas sp.]|jgi:hypothetical protein